VVVVPVVVAVAPVLVVAVAPVLVVAAEELAVLVPEPAAAAQEAARDWGRVRGLLPVPGLQRP
jgi:hypothetical protein